MGFQEVKLADVELEKFESLPAGSYTFAVVPGAEFRTNKFNGVEELNLSFVVTEGDFAGRRIFQTYPDSTALNKKTGKPMTWSAQALKKLSVVIGIDPLEGEDLVTYFNRIAVSGNARFTGQMAPGKYIPEGQTEPKVEFNIFTVSPAA
jgi:hypothetical protein